MKDAGRYTKERRGRGPELRRRRYLKFDNVVSTDTECTETGAVPKNREGCGGWILSESGTKRAQMEKKEVIFENRILLILKRCSHLELLADMAQIFKKRLRTSRKKSK